MQIKSLTMRAKAVVDGFTAGLHRSALHGFSVEFAQYRPYVPGDDPRNLDWKLLARTDRCYVKQYEDETNRRCYLAVDQSRSMNYAKQGYSKAEYARTLAATFAYYLHLQRDAVGILACGAGPAEFLPPRHRSGHLQQIMGLLGLESIGEETKLGESLEQLAGVSKRRGLVVLISDLLTEPESLYQPLGYLRGRNHEMLIVRVLDPSELDLEMSESTVVRDMESGREMFVDPGAAKAQYRQEFDKHREQLEDICHRRTARLVTITTDQPLDFALLELLSNTSVSPLKGPAANQLSSKRAAAVSLTLRGG